MNILLTMIRGAAVKSSTATAISEKCVKNQSKYKRKVPFTTQGGETVTVTAKQIFLRFDINFYLPARNNVVVAHYFYTKIYGITNIYDFYVIVELHVIGIDIV